MVREFITWEYMASFSGCLLGTVAITEFIKRMAQTLDKRVYQIISLFVAMLILIIAQKALGQTISLDTIGQDFFNAIVVSLASNGGYDAGKTISNLLLDKYGVQTDIDTEMIDEGDEE